MSDMSQFFSLSDWGYDYEVETFETEEEARNSIQATVDTARAGPGG
jgi:hypothetical protein